MKKGLLLSIVASTVIFAGGDIAPVAPASPAPAADCSDFYGSVGFHYRTSSTEEAGVKDRDLFDVHEIGVHATLGVEKEIAYGIGFGAEIAGWSSLGAIGGGDWVARGGREEGAELSMLYLTASFGNTAIKAGRYALPKALSPYAWTDSTLGVKDITFEGILVANTDIADTTLYGTYVHSYVNGSTRTHIGGANDEIGLFALGFVNSSISDVKLSGVGYYIPRYTVVGTNEYAAYSGFLTADTTFAGLKASVRLGVAAGDDEASVVAGKSDATFGVSAQIAGSASIVDWKLIATYINDGSYDIGYKGVFNPFFLSGSQMTGTSSYAIGAYAKAQVGPGTLDGRVEYTDWDTTGTAHTADTKLHARIGYGMKVFGDVSAKVEYRYTKTDFLDNTEKEVNEIRVDATYKF